MRRHLVLATLALSAVAFGQQDGAFQVGSAANLNVGDSAVNLSNDGAINQAGLGANPKNICANLYVFDPQEEEIGCCSCLVTPNGLNSLSVKNDLIPNNLTPAVPSSVTMMLVGSVPDPDASLNFTVCNPANVETGVVTLPITFISSRRRTTGLLAWATTLAPSSTPSTYSPIEVGFYRQADWIRILVIKRLSISRPKLCKLPIFHFRRMN